MPISDRILSEVALVPLATLASYETPDLAGPIEKNNW